MCFGVRSRGIIIYSLINGKIYENYFEIAKKFKGLVEVLGIEKETIKAVKQRIAAHGSGGITCKVGRVKVFLSWTGPWVLKSALSSFSTCLHLEHSS